MSQPLILNLRRHPIVEDPVELTGGLLAAVREPTMDVVRVGKLAGQLRDVDPTQLEASKARLAFWINLYNALVTHSLRLGPRRRSVLLEMRQFGRASYAVGEGAYSPNQIEHGLLRGNARPPYQPQRTLAEDDPRLLGAPAGFDPRVHFALNCGAVSCPPVAAYEPDRLDMQLGLATRAYLASESRVDARRRRIELPGLMHLYRRDFGSRDEILRFAATHSPAIAAVVHEGGRPRVTYRRFDWTASESLADPVPAGTHV